MNPEYEATADGRVRSAKSLANLQPLMLAIYREDWKEALRLLQFGDDVDVTYAEYALGLQLPIHLALSLGAPQQVGGMTCGALHAPPPHHRHCH